ncbi:MAG TPA: GH116 family glycosyl hydrolase, partial [Terriglobales bacterium]|nr:GH116 family glycosyl hydrolase [Terriglobales bacterium]
MKTSRRRFLQAAATASAALATPLSPTAVAAPYQVRVSSQPEVGAGTDAITIPASMAMRSGAPLGGIGTGFIELRPDGGFYEWQIFNSGAWAGHRDTSEGAEPLRSQYLGFLLRTKTGAESAQLRRLYLSGEENDLYSLPYVHDVESIDYEAWFPLTGLTYNDSTIPIRVSAIAFSPFIPGKTRASATPGFHMVFTLENTSRNTVEASLISLLHNPLFPELEGRMLNNIVSRDGATTSILQRTDADPQGPERAGIGNLCMSLTDGEHSWISGTFQQYTGSLHWDSPRFHAIRLSLLEGIFKTGKLPNSEIARDISHEFQLSGDEIDALSSSEVDDWMRRLFADVLVRRIFDDAQVSDPEGFGTLSTKKALLKELARNFAPPTGTRGRAPQHLKWGTSALASMVRLEPGQHREIRFTLSWFFPHHITRPRHAHSVGAPTPTEGSDIGHMYANWFKDAAEVNKYLVANYASHRQATETFARTLADTSLGGALAFVWSSQLGTMITNTWWVKDGGYGIWEGLGCCGHSTTDVDYQGSHPVAALFPELKLSQSRRIIRFQNEKGQVPHNFDGDFDHVDDGFNRVDMNPQYVMMACRDYLWTGDKDYLEELWPYLVKAMDYTASLDTNGDGLPDKNTGLQTYDQWAMRGTPSYVASLWIGGLRAAIRMATDLGKRAEAERWKALLDKASANFDRLLFNGQYYRLWIDGEAYSDICMSDQISGEWFTRLIGLPTTILEKNLEAAIDSIVKYNFNPEFGLHNATAPKGGADLLAMTNMQAGGVWTGIEFAFASFLMDSGRFSDGARIVESVHRRYLRAGRPWNHVECGDHYSRPPSSWTTMISATGFKPDVPRQMLSLLPNARGDFHAPWATASGFGTVGRRAQMLSLHCAFGKISFAKVQVNLTSPSLKAKLEGRALQSTQSAEGEVITIEFAQPISVQAGQT